MIDRFSAFQLDFVRASRGQSISLLCQHSITNHRDFVGQHLGQHTRSHSSCKPPGKRHSFENRSKSSSTPPRNLLGYEDLSQWHKNNFDVLKSLTTPYKTTSTSEKPALEFDSLTLTGPKHSLHSANAADNTAKGR
jgi:hypothetical protein